MESESLVLYYYFSSDTSRISQSSPTSAYRAILSQALHQNSHDASILDKFLFSHENTMTGQLLASNTELTDMLRFILPNLGPLYIILDGIDECSDSTALLQVIRSLLCHFNIKVLFSSQVSIPGLSRAIKEDQRISMDRSVVSEDINR